MRTALTERMGFGKVIILSIVANRRRGKDASGPASSSTERLDIGGYWNAEMDRRLRFKRFVVIESVSAKEGAQW